VFGSKAALEILKKSSPNKRIYQKDLIVELSFSNKTIIKVLQKLVLAGVLEQGMERRKEKGKTVWTKWYTPTFQGKWITLLLQSPENLPKIEAKKIITELFMMYIENITTLCQHYNIESEIFESTINKAFIKIAEGSNPEASAKSDVLVYGTSAIDTIIRVNTLPKIGETLYLSDVQMFSGGSASNVAVGVRRLGIPVSFSGKIGEDVKALSLIEEFKKEGVDTSGIIIEPDKKTLTTLITLNRSGEKRIYVLGGENVALSLSSPNEVNWKRITENKLIYIGEIFVELAEIIATYAKNHGKKVIYRPGLPIITFNTKKVRNALRNADIFILNTQSWAVLKEAESSTPFDLLKMGPEIVILTKGLKGCETYTKNGVFMNSAYSVEAEDDTGAGDAFCAGLICALLDSKSLKQCVQYALAASAISILKKGARTALPTRSQVEEFMKYEKSKQ